MMKIIKKYTFLLLLIGLSTAVIAKENKDNEEPVVKDTSLYEDQMADLDPLEPINRGIFAVNTFLDGLLIRPMAYAYEDLVADVIKDRVSNVMNNLAAPIIFVNDLLQGEGEQAMTTLMRFFINTTFGILGLFDPAAEIGIDHKKNDFDTTFRRWGIGAGPYIVLPLFGPSSFRNLVGDVGEYFSDPYNWYMRTHGHKKWVYVRTGVKGFIKRHKLLDITDKLDKTSDPYAQYRILYMQNRKIIDAIEESAVPDDMIDITGTSDSTTKR